MLRALRPAQPGTGQSRTRFRADPVFTGIAVPTLILFAWFLTPLGGLQAQGHAFWLAQSLYSAAYALLNRRVAVMPALPSGARRFWKAMFVAGVCFTIGDSYEAVLITLRPAALANSPSAFEQVCVVAGVAGVVWALVTHPSGAASRRERVRFWLDSITVLTAAAVFVWYFTFQLGAAQDDLVGRVAIPVAAGVFLVAVFGIVRVVFGDSPLSRATALTCISASVGQWLVTVLPEILSPDPNPHLRLAIYLIPPALAVAAPRIQELQIRADPRILSSRRTRRPYSVLAYLAMAATLGLLVTSLVAKIDLRAWGVVAGVVFIVVAVVLRQLDAFAENATLLSQLDASMRELTRQEQRFRSLVQHASDIVLIADATGIVRYASPAVHSVLEVSPDEQVGAALLDRVHPDDAREVAGKLAEVAATAGAVVSYDARVRHRTGAWRWLHVISTNLLDEPSVAGIVCNARDITEARQLHDQLRYDAYHDSLTGLANRALFHEMLESAPPSTATLTILLIDLDGFKEVNDVHGHHVGDELLVATAGRLNGCVRETDTVARLGGDEFAILLPDVDAASAPEMAERVRRALCAPATIAGIDLKPRASVGSATGRPDRAAALLQAADAAMYQRKRNPARPSAAGIS